MVWIIIAISLLAGILVTTGGIVASNRLKRDICNRIDQAQKGIEERSAN